MYKLSFSIHSITTLAIFFNHLVWLLTESEDCMSYPWNEVGGHQGFYFFFFINDVRSTKLPCFDHPLFWPLHLSSYVEFPKHASWSSEFLFYFQTKTIFQLISSTIVKCQSGIKNPGHKMPFYSTDYLFRGVSFLAAKHRKDSQNLVN